MPNWTQDVAGWSLSVRNKNVWICIRWSMAKWQKLVLLFRRVLKRRLEYREFFRAIILQVSLVLTYIFLYIGINVCSFFCARSHKFIHTSGSSCFKWKKVEDIPNTEGQRRLWFGLLFFCFLFLYLILDSYRRNHSSSAYWGVCKDSINSGGWVH